MLIRHLVSIPKYITRMRNADDGWLIERGMADRELTNYNEMLAQ